MDGVLADLQMLRVDASICEYTAAVLMASNIQSSNRPPAARKHCARAEHRNQ